MEITIGQEEIDRLLNGKSITVGEVVVHSSAVKDRFWSKVNKEGPTPKHCPELGPYGVWPNPCALHKCDNPPCVRPSHLFEGSLADNNKDTAAKGRTKGHVGENNNQAKLTRKEVEQIRKLHSEGSLQSALAHQFGVSKGHINNIVKRRVWTK